MAQSPRQPRLGRRQAEHRHQLAGAGDAPSAEREHQAGDVPGLPGQRPLAVSARFQQDRVARLRRRGARANQGFRLILSRHPLNRLHQHTIEPGVARPEMAMANLDGTAAL